MAAAAAAVATSLAPSARVCTAAWASWGTPLTPMAGAASASASPTFGLRCGIAGGTLRSPAVAGKRISQAEAAWGIACGASEQVVLTPAEGVSFVPNPEEDPDGFPTLGALADWVQGHGYYGGIRILMVGPRLKSRVSQQVLPTFGTLLRRYQGPTPAWACCRRPKISRGQRVLGSQRCRCPMPKCAAPTQAMCKRFAEYCSDRGIELEDKGFALSYASNIPRQCGLRWAGRQDRNCTAGCCPMAGSLVLWALWDFLLQGTTLLKGLCVRPRLARPLMPCLQDPPPLQSTRRGGPSAPAQVHSPAECQPCRFSGTVGTSP